MWQEGVPKGQGWDNEAGTETMLWNGCEGGGILQAIHHTVDGFVSMATPLPPPFGSLCPGLFPRRLTPCGCIIQETFPLLPSEFSQ